jgi:SAM-dependent methyltransferase
MPPLKTNLSKTLEIDRTISPNDAMHVGPEEWYFRIGQSGLQCIQRVLGDVQPSSILDLPSGHGGVLRYLTVEYPEAEIVACDIDRDGVDFCVERFGATGVYSEQDPQQIQLGRTFDLIWCGSLLTHVPEWKPWLDLFHSSLSEDGVLIFSTAGRFVIETMRRGKLAGITADAAEQVLRDYEATGFGYADYPSQRGYGLARAHPSYVLSLLEDFRVVSMIEHEYAGRQDVYAATLRPLRRRFRARPPTE